MWFYVFLSYVTSLYLSLPFVRGWSSFLRDRGLLRISIAATGMAMLIGVFCILIFKMRMLKKNALLLCLGICIVFGGCMSFIKLPEERMHLIEYGPLYFLALLTLRPYLDGARLHLSSYVLCALIGLGDELLQGIFPDRYFEWWDVGLNAFGSLLGLLTYLSIIHLQARGASAAKES